MERYLDERRSGKGKEGYYGRRTELAACEAVNRENERLMADINRFADVYPNEIIETFREKAKQTFRSVNLFQDSLSLFETTDGEALIAKEQRSFTHDWPSWSNLQDSLLVSYRPVEEINTEIRQILTGDPQQLSSGDLHDFLKKPGEYPLTVNLTYKNPLTGQVKPYVRTFYINIQP